MGWIRIYIYMRLPGILSLSVCVCSGHLLEEHGESVLAGQGAVSGRGRLSLQYP